MKLVSIFTLFIVFLTACSGSKSYSFWEISKFNLVASALKDNEEIKILYSSRGPDNNEQLEYYIHLVAVSQKTGDTVNVLTPVHNNFSMDDQDKVFNYFDQNNIVSKLLVMDKEKLNDVDNVNELNKTTPKKIKKVARDPVFDHIADNNYPTVIGTVGTNSKY